MGARSILLVVVAAVVAGLVIVSAGVALIFLAWNGGPHPLTGAELLTRPEANLLYPGAHQLSMSTQDETHPLFEGPTQADVVRTFATADPMANVVAWYDGKLKALGYTSQPGGAGEFANWRHGNSYFSLVYGRPTSGIHVPAGEAAFTTGLTVAPGG